MVSMSTAGVRPPEGWKSRIDRKDVTRPDGTADYVLLMKKVNGLGIMFQKTQRIVDRLGGRI